MLCTCEPLLSIFSEQTKYVGHIRVSGKASNEHRQCNINYNIINFCPVHCTCRVNLMSFILRTAIAHYYRRYHCPPIIRPTTNGSMQVNFMLPQSAKVGSRSCKPLKSYNTPFYVFTRVALVEIRNTTPRAPSRSFSLIVSLSLSG